MEEETIVRYLNGELSEEERKLFLEEVEKNAEFQRLYIRDKNIWSLNKAVHASPVSSLEIPYEHFERIRKHRQREKFRRLWNYCRNTAAMLALPLAVSLWFLLQEKPEMNYAAPVSQTISTPMGVKGEISLPDGTKVWLNCGSSLSYPVAFTGLKRKVLLQGEAFFDVKRDSLFPFEVELPKGAKIEVLGTSFNVSSYDNDPSIETTLVSGEVIFKKDGNQIRMKPSDRLMFVKSRNKVVQKVVDTDLYTSWKENKLVFRNAPMEEVIRKMERWYGVKIEVLNKKIYTYSITATFHGENLTQVLDLLRISSPMSYRIEEERVFLK